MSWKISETNGLNNKLNRNTRRKNTGRHTLFYVLPFIIYYFLLTVTQFPAGTHKAGPTGIFFSIHSKASFSLVKTSPGKGRSERSETSAAGCPLRSATIFEAIKAGMEKFCCNFYIALSGSSIARRKSSPKVPGPAPSSRPAKRTRPPLESSA